MWQRLVITHDVVDVLQIMASRRALFGTRMLEGEKLEDHMREMQVHFDRLHSINTAMATSYDWVLSIVSSFPASWDIFVQTLQGDINSLKWADEDANKTIASSVHLKITAEASAKPDYRRRSGQPDLAPGGIPIPP